MLALLPKLKTYPVLLPDPPEQGSLRRASRRRRPLAPATRMMLVAAAAVLPAIAYVHETAVAARTGYAILGLRQEIRALQVENTRLVAAVMRLRAPDRIERIAVRDLGMRPPTGAQLTSLEIAPLAAAPVQPSRASWRQRLSDLLLGREAEASEPR